MHNTSTLLALSALRHWIAHAAEQPATVPPHTSPLLRQTAWALIGQAPPSGEAWPAVTPGCLHSIFQRINGATATPAFLQPQPLRIAEQVIFPTVDPPARSAALLAALADAATEVDRRASSPAEKLHGLLNVLQRYAWALPSPLEAVSLADFARLHAALVAAQAADAAPEPTLCLLGGDLSGIQEFIYSVPARGAARQLRGRSLYLQLLTDACAHYLLEQTGMPPCNLLYAGGGRFYLVLPGSAFANLDAWRRAIGRHLLAAHHGALYLALGATPPFTLATYHQQTQWPQLTEAIDADKRRRFAALNSSDFGALFTPRQPEPPREDAPDDAEPTDRMGDSLELLGRTLSRATVLHRRPGRARLSAPPERELAYSQVLDGLGLHTEPGQTTHDAAGQTLYLADPPDAPDVLSGMRYTVTEARRATEADVQAYQRLGLAEADDQPLSKDNVWPFSFLAKRSTGVKRLGVLRMDVDNLGDLFRDLDRAPGIGALAHTAALSAALSRFFEGWVEVICREYNQHEHGGIYAVYSGGDDLFLIGSWHLMPHLARRIRDDFARYVLGRPLRSAERPPITLSAGITLHTASYPLYQAADEAAEALDAAKRLTRPDRRSKDAIGFLGQSLGWEQFAEVEALQAELKALIDEGAPRGLLMTIQNLAAQATAGDRRTRSGAPQLSYGPWIWQGAYQLTRLAERAPTEALAARIADLRDRLVGPAGIAARTIERAGLAARWTQLLIRNSQNATEEAQEVFA